MNPMSEKEIRKIAKKSDHRFHHHVAIICNGNGTIVATAFNFSKIHAEEMAIRKLEIAKEMFGVRHDSALRLYSVRIRRDGKIGASKPCDDCMREIREAGIRRVYYHDYDGREQMLRLG